MIQRKPYMLLQLRLEQESFDELREWLRVGATNNLGIDSPSESIYQRRRREALEKVFEQIRYVEYRGA